MQTHDGKEDFALIYRHANVAHGCGNVSNINDLWHIYRNTAVNPNSPRTPNIKHSFRYLQTTSADCCRMMMLALSFWVFTDNSIYNSTFLARITMSIRLKCTWTNEILHDLFWFGYWHYSLYLPSNASTLIFKLHSSLALNIYPLTKHLT